jgi:hypothetical protein
MFTSCPASAAIEAIAIGNTALTEFSGPCIE